MIVLNSFPGVPYRVLSVSYHGELILLTVSRVFDDSHETQIVDARTGQVLFIVAGAETLLTSATRFRQGKWETWWSMEWGNQCCLRLRGGKFKYMASTGEPWAVSTLMWQRKTKLPIPMTGVNGVWPWGAGGFQDPSRIIHMGTGKKQASIPAQGFPNTILQHGGYSRKENLYAFLYFCNRDDDTGLWRPDGWNMLGDFGHGVSVGKYIVCGGGKLRVKHRTGHENGRLYRINPKNKRVKTLAYTGSARNCQNVFDGKRYVYSMQAEPYALWRIDTEGWTSKRLWWSMASLPHSANSFGASLSIKFEEGISTELAWAYSKNRTPYVMTMKI